MENYAHESSVVMTDLLRNELGYTGIIQTDWGLNHTAAALAGATPWAARDSAKFPSWWRTSPTSSSMTRSAAC